MLGDSLTNIERAFGPEMTNLSTVTDGDNIATFSQCGAYRYRLEWRWSDVAHPDFRTMYCCMLNPSTADASKLDPTITRIVNRAKVEGFGAAVIVNLFGLRATHPSDLLSHAKPVGDDNDAVLREALTQALNEGSPMLVGWGNHGAHLDRANIVAQMAMDIGAEMVALGVNKNGQPKHPLYVRNVTQPVSWASPQ